MRSWLLCVVIFFSLSGVVSAQEAGLFNAMQGKLDYLKQRQKVLSKNIANADTPGYKAQDIEPIDFNRKAKEGGAFTNGCY